MNKEDKKKKKDESFSPLKDSASPFEIADKNVVGKEGNDTLARLLIVDDDGGVRSLLKDLLVESNYKVDTASCGEEALKKIRATQKLEK